MVTVGALWLPIIIAAVLVFVASSIMWMVMPHHKNEYKKIPGEDGVMEHMKGLKPGLYTVPFASSAADLKDDTIRTKFEDGPVAYLAVAGSGIPPMGKKILGSFLLYLVGSAAVAYVATLGLDAGAAYMAVFRYTAVVAFLTYGIGIVQNAIWFGYPWSSVAKHLLDSFVYGLLTAGAFGWLWP